MSTNDPGLEKPTDCSNRTETDDSADEHRCFKCSGPLAPEDAHLISVTWTTPDGDGKDRIVALCDDCNPARAAWSAAYDLSASVQIAYPDAEAWGVERTEEGER